MRALVTGFEGFAGKVNPSGMIAKDLDGKKFGKLNVIGRELPEDFYEIPKVIENLIRDIEPNIMISTGWDYISDFRAEKIGVNVMDDRFGEKRVPDNAGNSPTDEKVVERGPLALKSTFPGEQIVKALYEAGLPARLSYQAGTHCCNTVLYSTLYYARRLRPGSLCGFIHIPPIPEMKLRDKAVKSVSLSKETKAVELALTVCQKQAEKSRNRRENDS